MKRSIIFLIVVSMIGLFFFGCRHGGQGSFIKKEAERQIISKSGTVSDDGSLAPIVFPSGATIKATEANTMKYGVKVTVTEEKVPNNQDSTLGSASELYVYSVTAKLYSDNPMESPVPVATLEKPFTFTIPNNISDRGTCYIGVREDPDSPWRYFRASDQNMVIANYMPIRISQTAPKEITLTLYRAGIQIALFVLDTSKSILSTVDITESTVEEPLVTKKDYYQSDLKLSSILKGTGLNKLKNSDFSVRITFDSDIANLTKFKADGSSYNLNMADNKAATGGKYAYSFDVKNVTIKNQSDTELDFDLVLNTNKMSIEDFHQGFLVEIYSVTDNNEIQPFIYSQYVTYETVEAPTEYLIEYNLDGGIVAEENPVCYYTASETITLNNPTKEGYTFVGWTESNGDVPQIIVTIEQGSTGDKTYTAHWSEVAYVITYNLDGGTVAIPNSTGYNIASETFVLNEPTKVGYTFIGWTGSNGDVPQKLVSIVQGSKSDLSFTANYSLISYNIAYNLDGGTVATPNPTNYDVTSATITLNQPTRVGYAFAGWTGSNGDEPQITVSIEQGSTGDKTYTAQWSEVAYTITYNLDGGVVTPANPTGYNISSETFVLNEPTKTGYTFLGWTGSNGDVPQKLVSIVHSSTSDLSFTANWSINSYRLDIVKGAGIYTVTGDGLHKYNSSVTASCTMLVGYEFDSWSGDFTTETFTMPATNATMTANAKPIVYNITYEGIDGATFAIANPTTYDITSATINLNEPTKVGYTFLGWTGSNGDVPQKSVSIVHGSSSDLSFTANYSPISYSIVYILNDGTVATPNPISYDITSDTITLNNPTRDGYAFLGWTGTDLVYASSTLSIVKGSTGNRSYTANWIEGKTFTLPGGVELVMHKIPAGIFTMGSSADELGGSYYSDERPQHQVTISESFYIGKFEVTQNQFFAVKGYNPSDFCEGATILQKPTTSANYPVEMVSWLALMEAKTGFIAKINEQLADQIPAGYKFDLPTEAQWEYACRAGTATSLNNGTNITVTDGTCPNLSLVSWYSAISSSKTHTVGEKQPNAWGLYDMHGNVSEWCKDWYYSMYYTTCGDCTDPVGPNDGSNRVVRGGGYNTYPGVCRSARRGLLPPIVTQSTTGFRLVLVKTP